MTMLRNQVHECSSAELKVSRPPTPLGETAKGPVQDVMLQELEEHSPEGRETHGISPGMRRLAYLAAILATAGALAALAILAGPPALLLGIALVVVMYGVAAMPQWSAAKVRREERGGFERRIEAKVKRFQRRASRPAGGS